MELAICLTKMLEESLSNTPERTAAPDWKYLEDSNTYSFELPTTKLNVQIKLLTAEDTNLLEASKQQKQKLGLPYNETVEFLRACIIQAQGVVDRTSINKLAEILPAADARKIRVVHNENMPKVKTTTTVHCNSCGHENKKEVPFSLGWFWLD